MKFEGEEGTQDWELEQQRLNQLPKSFKLRGFDSTTPWARVVTAKNLPKLPSSIHRCLITASLQPTQVRCSAPKIWSYTSTAAPWLAAETRFWAQKWFLLHRKGFFSHLSCYLQAFEGKSWSRNNLLDQPYLMGQRSRSPTYALPSNAPWPRQVDLPPPDLVLVLLLVLLDADQVLPPEILRHMAGSVGIVSQRLGHLLGNHHQGEDENCHICVLLNMIILMIHLLSCMHTCAVYKTVRPVD